MIFSDVKFMTVKFSPFSDRHVIILINTLIFKTPEAAYEPNMWLFQKVLLIQNPEPYLMQRRDSDSAIAMKDATLFWTKPDSRPAPPAGVDKEHNKEETSENAKTDTLPTLRNISFTLPKVCCTCDEDKLVYIISDQHKLNICVLFPEGQPAWCLWECGERQDVTDFQHFGTSWSLLCFLV